MQRGSVKVQLISKCIFVSSILPKTKEKIEPNYYRTSSWIIFVRSLDKLKKSKRHFEINWPLGRAEIFSRICHAIYVNAMVTVPPTIRFMLSLFFYRVSYIALIYVTFLSVWRKSKFQVCWRHYAPLHILNVIILEKLVA